MLKIFKKESLEYLAEATTWIVMLGMIGLLRFLPQHFIETEEAYVLAGAVLSFALIYYFYIHKNLSRSKRLYVKNIADVVLIGILISIAKEFKTYFFALYFLPITAAAIYLNLISGILIALIASVFVVGEIFFSSQNQLGLADVYIGVWQVVIIVIITIFCRFLALQIGREKEGKAYAEEQMALVEKERKKENELFAMVSHQLFTPLSIIRGFASMLDGLKFGPLNPKQKDAVEHIHQNSKRMVGLVNELLIVSRIRRKSTTFQTKKSSIAEIIKDAIESLKPKAEEAKVKVTFEASSSPLPSIMVDPEMIIQVIINLIDNGIKYNPGGEVKISAQATEKEIIVRVKDNGVGVAKEIIPRLFEPFVRGENILELDNKGTGLGLSIAKNIIDIHKGRIWAESQKGKGAEFAFSLPL